MKNLALVIGAAAGFLLSTTGFASATAVPIPEPGTIALLGAGVVGLVAVKVYRGKR